MPDPSLPRGCPACGAKLTYLLTIADTHIYSCLRDGLAELPPAGIYSSCSPRRTRSPNRPWRSHQLNLGLAERCAIPVRMGNRRNSGLSIFDAAMARLKSADEALRMSSVLVAESKRLLVRSRCWTTRDDSSRAESANERRHVSE